MLAGVGLVYSAVRRGSFAHDRTVPDGLEGCQLPIWKLHGQEEENSYSSRLAFDIACWRLLDLVAEIQQAKMTFGLAEASFVTRRRGVTLGLLHF
jgi:hypothetical protein